MYPGEILAWFESFYPLVSGFWCQLNMGDWQRERARSCSICPSPVTCLSLKPGVEVTQPAAQSSLQRSLEDFWQDKVLSLGVAIWTDDDHWSQRSSHHPGLAFDILGLNGLFSVIFKQEGAANLQTLVQCFTVQHCKTTTLKTERKLDKDGCCFQGREGDMWLWGNIRKACCTHFHKCIRANKKGFT